VGTEKRERQKANRQQRLIEEARTARVGKIRRSALRWTIGGLLAVGAVVLIAWLGGAFDGDDTEDATPATLPPVETVPSPDQPEVRIPDSIPTELEVTPLVTGSGPEAELGDTVSVFYVGVLSEDGTEFDSNYGSGQPFDVLLGAGRVIAGWDQGLVGVQAGGRYQLDIPSDLAYGATGQGDIIGPDAALTFVVDVVDIQKGDS
jgi:peptidylprolyl isomerase